MEAEVGMLVVETIGKIRRAYFVDGRPIKAICRELGVSRKVVRKVIRSQATEFRYERAGPANSDSSLSGFSA
ncbi:integrase catalytic subunit (plasmid) [Bradyrhizobium diazoefficiens]|uniref:Integrase catalytic subunit n=1 Tax=Bradyrhizobium diazoefficiens TaxID=1355477 RepID=A0A0E4FYY8_9BRAD|nr:integrase catalytic subunit [Bradyrhizobium diazoefficiens]